MDYDRSGTLQSGRVGSVRTVRIAVNPRRQHGEDLWHAAAAAAADGLTNTIATDNDAPARHLLRFPAAAAAAAAADSSEASHHGRLSKPMSLTPLYVLLTRIILIIHCQLPISDFMKLRTLLYNPFRY